MSAPSKPRRHCLWRTAIRWSAPARSVERAPGAAAALIAAAELGSEVGAVVSRGGRPDLAAPRLVEVRAPTLLIVGGDDLVVLRLNR